MLLLLLLLLLYYYSAHFAAKKSATEYCSQDVLASEEKIANQYTQEGEVFAQKIVGTLFGKKFD